MRHKTTLGLLNATINVEFKQREDYGNDLVIEISQKVDSAYTTSHTFNCVTKDEVKQLIASLQKTIE